MAEKLRVPQPLAEAEREGEAHGEALRLAEGLTLSVPVAQGVAERLCEGEPVAEPE